MMRISLAILLLGSLSACEASREDPTAAHVEVRDSAGITISVSSAPVEGAGAWALSEAPIHSFGAMEGEPAYLFSRIRDIEIAAGGQVVVANGQPPEIRIFSPEAQHLQTVGGQGRGPGEFVRISGVELENDSIISFDPGQGRIQTFTLDGELAATQPVQQPGERSHFLYGLLGVIEDRRILAPAAYPADMRPEPVRYWDTLPVFTYERDGRLVDTVGEYMGMDTYSTPRRAGSVTFGRFSSAAMHGDRIAQTDGGRLDIRIYHASGPLTAVYRADVHVSAATDEVLERYVEQRLESVDPERVPEVRQQLREWPRRDSVPLISTLIFDEEGFLWAEESTYHDAAMAGRWFVFDPEGRWVTTVERPTGFRLFAATERRVVGVHTDPDTRIESIRIYGLDRG